jgi:hypothetical protein
VKSAFRKLSRVADLTGGIRWYLSDDCLLSAKRMMYSVEYRRFYLRDLESVVVWSSRLWLLRLVSPALLFAGLGAALWQLSSTTGAIFVSLGAGWVLLELVLGPTAKARIRTTGATVDLPLVTRTRRARKVLDKIDAATRAARGIPEPGTAPVTSSEPEELSVQASSEATPATAAIADATQTNGS